MKITSETQQKIKPIANLVIEPSPIVEFHINTQENLFINSKNKNKPIGIIWPFWVGKYFHPNLKIDFLQPWQAKKYQNLKNDFKQNH